MSSEVIRRRTFGESVADIDHIIGKAALSPIVTKWNRSDYIRVIGGSLPNGEQIDGYAGILTDLSREEILPNGESASKFPLMFSVKHVEHINDGDILKLGFRNGYVQSLFRVNSQHNTIFITDQCNSNCIMCSQPPKDIDDSELIRDHLRLVSLIPNTTDELGITGGEPTLLREGLFQVLEACRDKLPNTKLHMLTNGRLFYYRWFTEQMAKVNHPNLTLGIPLYSDISSHHDYVVQAKGAFDQTMVEKGVKIFVKIILAYTSIKSMPFRFSSRM